MAKEKEKKKEESADEAMNQRIANTLVFTKYAGNSAAPKKLDLSSPEAQAKFNQFVKEAPAAPKKLDLSSPEAQAKFNQFVKEAPAAPKKLDLSSPEAAIGAGGGAAAPRMGESKTVDMDRAAMLFARTHGGPFDPKSSMDKKKMAAITNLMGQEGSDKLTPNQFALTIYRTTK